MLARTSLHPHQIHTQALEEDLVDKGGFAGTGYAGNTGKGTQRNGHIDLFQIVLRRTVHRQPVSVSAAAHRRHRNILFAGQIQPRQGLGVGRHFLRGAGGHNLAAVDTCAGSHIDDIVRRAHGVLVVLHHNQRVAQIPQMLKGVQQLVVVPLVQPDGRLVKDIEHSHQGRADLRGQADTLALTARQRGGTALQRQVFQPH